MAPPQEVVQWVNKNFPKPRVDPEWLDGCCEWLINDQKYSPVTAFPQFIAEVKKQLLESDLKDSMLHGTGLDANITEATEDLRGLPVLVQITMITEIGTSAFQLEQTRAAREERTLAGIGNEEGEDEGDVEVEGEGPMPKYPRGTLRFELSDGATVFDAVEYRPLPELTLGNTPLGYKIQLKGTHFQNGMAFLEPATVVLLEGKETDLDARRDNDLKRGLRLRLGRPYSPEPPERPHASPAPPAAVVRSPLRDISPPPLPDFPQHDDDIDMEPRRRLPAGSSLNDAPSHPSKMDSKNTRPIHGLPTRHMRASLDNNSIEDPQDSNAPNVEHATLVFGGTQRKKQESTSSYFGAGSSRSAKEERDRAIEMALQGLDHNLMPTTRQLSRTIPSPSPEPSIADHWGENRDPSFDFELLDQFDNDENQPPQPSKGKGKGPALQPPASLTVSSNNKDNDGSSDYGMDDDLDPEIFEHLDRVEKAHLESTPAHPPSFASGSGLGSGVSSSYIIVNNAKKSNSPSGTTSAHGHSTSSVRVPGPSTQVRDVIEIEDSDEEMLGAEDKENEPVPARHVRRRVDDDRSSSVLASQTWMPMPALSQRTGRPIILATNPADVIDLADSD